MKLFYTFAAMVIALAPSAAWAHFPFLHWTALDGKPVLQVYFAESPEPGGGEYLDRLVDGNAWIKPADGEAKAVELERTGEFLVARPEIAGPVVFGFSKKWGELSRGDETFELYYHAKAYSDRAAWAVDTGETLALDIRPSFKDGQLTATALWKNKPLANAEIVVQGGVEHFEGKTDAQGRFTCELSDPALYAIRVRHVEDSASRRHYATATIDLQKN